ncbi:uncharacterized protein ACNS7B_013505 [Menidia menidia]
MKEEITVAETGQGDAVNNEGKTGGGVSRRGRGAPQGSKKLKVCVTDINLTKLMSAHSNGEPVQIRRGRGRPRLSEQRGSGDGPADGKNQSSKEDGSTGTPPKKRGRPKKTVTATKEASEDLLNGGSDARNSPKEAVKRKSESLTSPRKRGRPKNSLNKKPRMDRGARGEEEAAAGEGQNSPKSEGRREATQDASNGVSEARRRGRPRKIVQPKSEEGQKLTADGSLPIKRGRGRPKGSLNKKPRGFKVPGKVGRPRKTAALPPSGRKRGRPRQQPAKRGRPRKYPLPSPEELKKKKVWKPLGRPRKYPRVDPPEGAPPAPQRGRGRPRKSESKKGAHLRKSQPAAPSSAQDDSQQPKRKRGRPPSTPKSQDGAPRRRGRPKGSLNKNKARAELSSTPPNHAKAEGDSPARESTATRHGGDAEEAVSGQDGSSDVGQQA